MEFANDVRNKARGGGSNIQRAVSTRQLLQAAVLARRMKAKGMKVRKAIEYTILPFYSEEGGNDSERTQVKLVIQGKFGD